MPLVLHIASFCATFIFQTRPNADLEDGLLNERGLSHLHRGAVGVGGVAEEKITLVENHMAVGFTLQREEIILLYEILLFHIVNEIHIDLLRPPKHKVEIQILPVGLPEPVFRRGGLVLHDVHEQLLPVDGVAATTENIQTGTYAISRPLNVIYQEATIAASPLYTDYLSFLSSSQAQDIIDQNGYVSIVSDAKQYAAPSTALSGEIDISGSTSLQPLMTILAEEYESLNSGVTVNVSGGGSGTGYENANSGVSAFGMISEEFNSSKADKCVPSTVAKDGIGIIVNKENPLNDISKADLKTIYDVDADPGFQSWSELIEPAE